MVLLWYAGVRKMRFDDGQMVLRRQVGVYRPLLYKIWLGLNLILVLTTIALMEAFFTAAPKPLSLFNNHTQQPAPLMYVSTYIIWQALQISALLTVPENWFDMAENCLQDVDPTKDQQFPAEAPLELVAQIYLNVYDIARTGPYPDAKISRTDGYQWSGTRAGHFSSRPTTAHNSPHLSLDVVFFPILRL